MLPQSRRSRLDRFNILMMIITVVISVPLALLILHEWLRALVVAATIFTITGLFAGVTHSLRV